MFNVADPALIQSGYIRNNFGCCFYNCVFDVGSRECSVLVRELQGIRNPRVKLLFFGCLTLPAFVRRNNTFYGISWQS